MEKTLLTERDDIFTIKGFFSDAMCSEYIKKCEDIGFDGPTVNTFAGPIVNKDMRSNKRVIVDDWESSGFLFECIREFLPGKPRAINERFRYYRYEPGQLFDWHFDHPFERGRESSRLTLMVYLNDDFTGGTTDFIFGSGVIREDEIMTVKPEKGMALVFTHNVLHRGAEVLTGKKYVLRSDVMY